MKFFENVANLIEQQPESVAQLFIKHRVQAPATYRNTSNALKVFGVPFFRGLSALSKKHASKTSVPTDQKSIDEAYELSDAALGGEFGNFSGTVSPDEAYHLQGLILELDRQAALKRRLNETAPRNFLALPAFNAGAVLQSPTAYNPYSYTPYSYGYGYAPQRYEPQEKVIVSANAAGSLGANKKLLWWVIGIFIVLYLLYKK